MGPTINVNPEPPPVQDAWWSQRQYMQDHRYGVKNPTLQVDEVRNGIFARSCWFSQYDP
jgi:hypothetical protein